MAMYYQKLSDAMWYFGHVLTGVAIVVNHYNYYVAIVVVFFGQGITMISRPVGRISGGQITIDRPTTATKA